MHHGQGYIYVLKRAPEASLHQRVILKFSIIGFFTLLIATVSISAILDGSCSCCGSGWVCKDA